MVWSSQAPQGGEAQKVKFETVPYMRGTILDLGCGPQKIFPIAIGVDDDTDLKLFGSKANFDIRANCTDLPFVDEYADTIFSSHLLEHVTDHKATLLHWWSKLKVGGHLILYLPHADHYPNIGMPGGNIDHKNDFRNADITDAMQWVAEQSTYGWEQLHDEVRTGGWEYSFFQVYKKLDAFETFKFEPKPKPEKSVAIVRLGAYGDALWISPVVAKLKRDGYHVTIYTQRQGETVLRHDPNIDRIICQADNIFGADMSAALDQSMYWLHEERKYDRFINLVGVCERELLPHADDFRFYFSHEQRQLLMNVNYMENVFRWCGLDYEPGKDVVQFYSTSDEFKWAAQIVTAMNGPFVVINPSGSSLPKWWPHAQDCMDLLHANGVKSVIAGDLRGHKYKPPTGSLVLGSDADIRQVFTLAKFADAVIGVESAVVNSVAHENCAKVVLLSHSSGENLTRDWFNTLSLSPKGLACYPCHRIHSTAAHCSITADGYAACQDGAAADVVASCVLEWINRDKKEAA